MYVITNHNEKISEWSEARHVESHVPDVAIAVEENKVLREWITDQDTGRPGHYYGRDVMVEGQMPFALFLIAEQEFGGDAYWYRDDAKFQSFMKRHPEWSLLAK